MTQQHSLVFFGNERLATGVTTECQVLRQLISAGYKIHAIVVNNDAARSRKERTLEIAEVAKLHNIHLLQPQNPRDITEQLAGYSADAAVLVAYGRIIPQSVIDIFPKGIINLHPSLLPLHRGPTPIESTIISGEKETAISIMQLAKEMDAGPVFAQKKQHISPDNPSKQLIADHFDTEGAALLLEVLPSILDGTLTPIAQEHGQATYDQLITQADGIINWQKDATTIQREIVAYAGWPRSKATLGSIDVIITEATAVDTAATPGTVYTENNELVVGCTGGGLKIEKLIPAGKKEMPASAFLAGYKSKLQ